MIEIAKDGATKKSFLYVLIAALIAVALACMAGSAIRAFAADETDADAQKENPQKVETQTEEADDNADKAKDADADDAKDAKDAKGEDADDEKADKADKADDGEDADADADADADEQDEAKEEAKSDKAAKSQETTEKSAASDKSEGKNESESSGGKSMKTQAEDPAVVILNKPTTLVAGDVPQDIQVDFTNADVEKVTIESSDATSLMPIVSKPQEKGGWKWLELRDKASANSGKCRFSLSALKITDKVTISIKYEGVTEPLATFDVKIDKRLAIITTDPIVYSAENTKAKMAITKGDGRVVTTSTEPSSPKVGSEYVATFEVELGEAAVDYTVSAAGYNVRRETIAANVEPPSLKETELIPTEYTITYKYSLDGKDKGEFSSKTSGTKPTNDPENPTIYSVKDNYTLIDPFWDEDEYLFLGWDKDEITVGSVGNKTFTAKFKSLKDGMTATVKPENPSLLYDAKWHTASDFGLAFTVKKESETAESKTYRVDFSADDKTYTSKESEIRFRDAGEHTLYYKIVDTGSKGDGSDREYKSYKGSVTVKINSFDTVTDSVTGIIAKGDVFKQYTTNGEIVQMESDDVTEDSDEASHISDLKKKYYNANTMQAFKVFDVSLYLLNMDDSSKDKELTSNFGKLSLTFPVGTALNGKTANVYELHNEGGKVTEIPFKNLKVANGNVVVNNVDKLSEFVVVVSKTAATSSSSSSSTSSKGSTSAKTGDTIAPWIPITIAVVAVALIALAVFRIRKLR